MASMATGDGATYNDMVETFREAEYPMLKDAVYLDHAGSTLCAKSVMESFAQEMSTVLYGNPHSASWPSQLSTTRIEDIRLRLLSFFHADPSQYDVVFVANATAAIKLVTEAVRSLPGGFRFAHHYSCHTSVVGVREEAQSSSCLDDRDMEAWAHGIDPFELSGSSQITPSQTTLFAWSAQSHLDGRRYPLSWAHRLNCRRTGDKGEAKHIYTMLDAASFCATSPLRLDCGTISADFVVLSLYKIFGFPDMGALLVRREAEHVFDHKRYFGGGTVDMVVTGKESWHAPKSRFLHERLEDGTLPFHSIMAIDTAMAVHARLYHSMDAISRHTSQLSHHMRLGLAAMRHYNGNRVCKIHGDVQDQTPDVGQGPIVSFNLLSSQGHWISLPEFEKLANLKKMYVRTGSVCSPGGIAAVLDLEPWEMRRNFSAGYRCGGEHDVVAGKPTGVIRVSLGAMSTRSDVCKFIDFVTEFFVEKPPPASTQAKHTDTSTPITSKLRVTRMTVYPIKSCGGYDIAPGSRWGVRPEGLAWDREWCLLHAGSGQALSQKRYPRMALLTPVLDFDKGVLRVSFAGHDLPGIAVPLSDIPTLYQKDSPVSSRVCGDAITAKIYHSAEIRDFFTTALGVPCLLARFPPGGQGSSSRTFQLRGQCTAVPRSRPSAQPFRKDESMPSPPDSDSEISRKANRLLLANESPILIIHKASVDALSSIIQGNGGHAIPESAFRANIVVDAIPSSHTPPDKVERLPAYDEDGWRTLIINGNSFDLMGGCQRCQMICVDQSTGEKGQEPFLTLAKTRRKDGKVYFGVHMRLTPQELGLSHTQHPVIGVGDELDIS